MRAPPAAMLRACTGAAERLARDRAERPLDYMRWTPPQMALLKCSHRYALLRTGQQLGGKSTAGLADLIYRCLGRHPYQQLPPRPVGRAFMAWVICTTVKQSLVIQEKLYNLLPKGALHESVEYISADKGFRGKHTSIRFNNGAVIMFHTTAQGAEALASGTVDHILVDEPTTEAVWTECKARVRRSGGTIRATLTPVNIDCRHIRADCEAKNGRPAMFTDLHFKLTEENVIPEGATEPLRTDAGELIDADFIERERAKLPGSVVGMMMDGDWEERGLDRYFDCFVGPGLAGSHVSAPLALGMVDLDEQDGKIEMVLGIDHGDRPGKQIALLVAVQRIKGKRARVYVVDEYVDHSGVAAPEDDARGILAMLGRHGLQWTDLVQAMGDRVHMPGTGRQKSNRDLAAQVAKALRVPSDALRPPIRTAKRGEGRGKGSVGIGSRWLYYAMAKNALGVHPRCERLIWALNEWTGPGPDCPEKDPVDALRYALDRYIFGGVKAGTIADVRIG